jgi:DNA polymerase III subunit delta
MPVILLHGDNTLEIEAAAREVRSRFSDVDITLYDGPAVPLAELSMACATVGLFDPERLVIVRGLHERLKASRKDGELEELRRVLASVAPTTTLLLLSPDMDEKSQLPDMVREVSGEIRAFVTPKRADLPRWIARRAGEHGATIGRDAAELLAEMLGATPVMIDTELEKLATYVGGEGPITVDVIEQLVGSVTQESIFVLVDAVAGGDRATALRLLHGQLEASASSPIDVALYLIRMLARQFRFLLRIKVGLEAGESRTQLIATLKLNRYFADRYFRQAGRLSRDRLISAFERLAALEHALKSGRADAATGLDLLVAELCAA